MLNVNLFATPKCARIRLKFCQHNIPPKWNGGECQPVKNSKKMFLGHPTAGGSLYQCACVTSTHLLLVYRNEVDVFVHDDIGDRCTRLLRKRSHQAKKKTEGNNLALKLFERRFWQTEAAVEQVAEPKAQQAQAFGRSPVELGSVDTRTYLSIWTASGTPVSDSSTMARLVRTPT